MTATSSVLAGLNGVRLTVGSLQAGTKSNVIPEHAVLQLNIRTYSEQTRKTILEAVRRIVSAECQASGSPQDAEFELFDRFPLTDNDAATTQRVADAFTDFFGDRASHWASRPPATSPPRSVRPTPTGGLVAPTLRATATL